MAFNAAISGLIEYNLAINGMDVQPDGKIILKGRYPFILNNPGLMVRINNDGSVDETFLTDLISYSLAFFPERDHTRPLKTDCSAEYAKR
mgnify:CR=1 FL=1